MLISIASCNLKLITFCWSIWKKIPSAKTTWEVGQNSKRVFFGIGFFAVKFLKERFIRFCVIEFFTANYGETMINTTNHNFSLSTNFCKKYRCELKSCSDYKYLYWAQTIIFTDMFFLYVASTVINFFLQSHLLQ